MIFWFSFFFFNPKRNSMTMLSKPESSCFDRFVPASLVNGTYQVMCTDGETPVKSSIKLMVNKTIKPVIKKALPPTFTKGQVKFEVQVRVWVWILLLIFFFFLEGGVFYLFMFEFPELQFPFIFYILFFKIKNGE